MNHFDPTFSMNKTNGEELVDTISMKIRAWVTSTWMSDLIELFGGGISLEGSHDEVLKRLEAFSDRWDFRRIAREHGVPTDDQLRDGQGSARWLSAATGLPPDSEDRVLGDASRLGLVHSQKPAHTTYDYIVVLGGARLSCQLRSSLAAEVMRAGVRVAKVALLGAPRPIPDSERDATDTYAPGAVDEFDLIVAGGQQAFGFNQSVFNEDRHDDPGSRNLSWVVRRFEALFDSRILEILALSAPSSDPVHRRANSADTIKFFLDHEVVRTGSKLLLITSQIYVPYVQLEALRTVALPRHLWVETIGFPADRMPKLQGLSNTNHYLQEIRSAIQAARRFCQLYPEQNQ